jgi:PPOX class probable F420-dependent enzyme
MPKMTRDEALAFLAAGAPTAAVATTRPDGSPHVVPVWFVIDEGDVVFTCGAESVKARNLRHDPRIAISVDDDEFPYSFACVMGTAEIADRPGDLLAWTTRIAARYLPDRAEEYGKRDAELDDWVVRIRPERIFGTADLAL